VTTQKYCQRVLVLLEDADVCPEQVEQHRRDVLRARLAEAASKGEGREASRRVAEEIAARWELDP